MLEGLYTAAAGMAAQERRLDAVSNDIANVNTAGYKRVRIGRIQLLTVTAPNGLAPAGDNNYLTTAASGGIRRAGGQIVQGVLESSNVDLADAMVDMMDAQRSYSMASKAIHMQDQMMEIANGIKQ